MAIESSYPQVIDHCPLPDVKTYSSELGSIYISDLFDGGGGCNFDKARQSLKECLRRELGPDRAWQQFRMFVIDAVNKDIREAIKPGSNRFPRLFPQIPKSKAERKVSKENIKPQDLQEWSEAVAFGVMCDVVLGRIPARLEKSLPEFRKCFHAAVLGLKRAEDVKQSVNTINEFLGDVVETRQGSVRNGIGGHNRQDLLWRIISSDGGKMAGKSDLCLLRSMVKILILAGTATISTATTWFFRLLAIDNKHRGDVKFHAFQKEIHREVAGMENWRNQYLFDGLTYLDACLSEAIRVHSPFQNPNSLQSFKKPAPAEKEKCQPMADQQDKFMPERWIDNQGYLVGMDEWSDPRSPFSSEENERGSTFTKKMVFVVVKCVAVAVLCRYKVAEAGGAGNMTISVVDKKKRDAKRREIVEEEEVMKKADKEKKEDLG